MASRLYYDVSDYTRTEPYQSQYVKQAGVYTDSLLHYLPKGSAERLYAIGMRQMKERKYEASLDTFKQFLQGRRVDLHHKAIVTSCIGWIYLFLKENDQAMDYLAQAAIYDNEGVVRETTALCTWLNYFIGKVTYNMQPSMSESRFRMQTSMAHDNE